MENRSDTPVHTIATTACMILSGSAAFFVNTLVLKRFPIVSSLFNTIEAVLAIAVLLYLVIAMKYPKIAKSEILEFLFLHTVSYVVVGYITYSMLIKK